MSAPEKVEIEFDLEAAVRLVSMGATIRASLSPEASAEFERLLDTDLVALGPVPGPRTRDLVAGLRAIQCVGLALEGAVRERERETAKGSAPAGA